MLILLYFNHVVILQKETATFNMGLKRNYVQGLQRIHHVFSAQFVIVGVVKRTPFLQFEIMKKIFSEIERPRYCT